MRLPDGINYQCNVCGMCTDEFRFIEEHIKLTSHDNWSKRSVNDIMKKVITTIETIPPFGERQ